MDRVRRRGRADLAPAAGPDLGTSWTHPGGAGVGEGLGPDLHRRATGLPRRRPAAPVLQVGDPPRTPRGTPQPVRSRLRHLAHRRPPAVEGADHLDLGQLEHARQYPDAGLPRRTRRLADRDPVTRLCLGTQRRRVRVGPPQTQHRQQCRHRHRRPRRAVEEQAPTDAVPPGTCSTGSSDRPDSPSNPDRHDQHAPQPCNLCSACSVLAEPLIEPWVG